MRGKVDRAKIADKATPEARLAKLENKNVIPASVEPVTTVTTIQPSFPPGFEVPSANEFKRVERSVIGQFPRLIEQDYDPENFSGQFRNAFLTLALMRREDMPKGKHVTAAYLEIPC
jgi:hypothetical protein